MFALIHPRRIAFIVTVLASSLVGTLVMASPKPPVVEGWSSARECGHIFCPKRVWLRAPVLRSHTR